MIKTILNGMGTLPRDVKLTRKYLLSFSLVEGAGWEEGKYYYNFGGCFM